MSETTDRDANQALRDQLSDVYGQYEQLRTHLDELPQRLASMQVSAASADGLVQATVGPRGQLIDLRIDHEGYRRVDADDLAQAIVTTVRSAAERTAGEVESLLAGFLPPDSGTLRLLRDNDFASLMGRADSIMRSAALESDRVSSPGSDRASSLVRDHTSSLASDHASSLESDHTSSLEGGRRDG